MSPSNLREVEADCIRLSTMFAVAIDGRDYNKVLSLFTHTGVFEFGPKRCVGRDEIRKFLENRPKDLDTRHFCSNFQVQPVSENRAIGTCYVTCFKVPVLGGRDQAAPHTPSPIVAEFHDQYERTPDGWRIGERTVKIFANP